MASGVLADHRHFNPGGIGVVTVAAPPGLAR
jgi:hypothetical protein